MRGIGATASLFPGGPKINATLASPRNPSDDDFDTPEVFPEKCMHQTFSQRSVGVTSEAETLHLNLPLTGNFLLFQILMPLFL